ncbi:MAG: hypothetical protein M1292_07860 [Bacteroidetes bacterium]|nr:hypothetical protein [Bacteroidota bacterium]
MRNLYKCLRNKRIIIALCGIMYSFLSLAQNNLTTKEYYKDNTIRREIVLNDNLDVLSETYFKNSQPVAKINYKSKNEMKNAVFYKEDGRTQEYYIDFEKGKYFDYSNEIELTFNGAFNFHGKQIGDKVISYYENGKRNGPVLQFDSTVTGKVNSNKVFAEYNYAMINGRMVITGKTLSPIYDDFFTLYKGAYLNFKNDLLDGESNVFYYDGKKKIKSNFNYGKCLNYSSFDNNGNLITKIAMKNGNLSERAIINGSVKEFEGNNIVWFKLLGKVGSIYSTYHPNHKEMSYDFKEFDPSIFLEGYNRKNYWKYFEFNSLNKTPSNDKWNTGQLITFKQEFDKGLSPADDMVIRLLLGIPYFYLYRYDFSNYSEEEYKIINISKNACIDSTGLHPEVNSTLTD